MSLDIGTTSLDKLPNVNEIVQTEPNNLNQQNNNLNNLNQQNNNLNNLNNLQSSNEHSNNNNNLNINRFVSDIQEASINGSLSLPSRDIPQNTTKITTDEKIKENYMPTTSNNDYITEYQTNQEILNKNLHKDNNKKHIDNIYNIISKPLLISLLYFLFQLPVIRNNFYKLFPKCYNVSGNFNIFGYILNSLLFGLIYFIINYLLQI